MIDKGHVGKIPEEDGHVGNVFFIWARNILILKTAIKRLRDDLARRIVLRVKGRVNADMVKIRQEGFALHFEDNWRGGWKFKDFQRVESSIAPTGVHSEKLQPLVFVANSSHVQEVIAVQSMQLKMLASV